MSSTVMTISVIVVTLNRPDCVRRCLERLTQQEPQIEQIIVVDASKDDATCLVVAEFPGVVYLRNENGYGRMTASRNIGILQATGDIIAFVDDDAFAHPGWRRHLTATYGDPRTGAVGGRALNNQPGEAVDGVGEIGMLKSNGCLTGNFAADPGKTIRVDHVMGCNMSFRREVVAELGGFREDYPGISGVREDTDMCLRVRRLGYHILFNPAVCVDHIGAPQANGRRFDHRYNYYSARNHVVMLIRNSGLLSGVLSRYLWHNLFAFMLMPLLRSIGAACVRFVVVLVGSVVGVASGVLLLLNPGRDPIRHDPQAERIRRVLSGEADLPGKEQPVVESPVAQPSTGS